MRKTKTTKYFVCVKNKIGKFIKLIDRTYASPEDALNGKIEFLLTLSRNRDFKKERDYIIENICIMKESTDGRITQKEFVPHKNRVES